MNHKKKSPLAGSDTGSYKPNAFHNTSLSAQRSRILIHLMGGKTLTTFEARNKLDIPHPAGRIRELRLLGYPIDKIWVSESGSAGVLHRIAKYYLNWMKSGGNVNVDS